MLVLPQELTHAQSPVAQRMLLAALNAESAQDVVLDCAPLHRFDSSALAVLLELNRASARAGKQLMLRACPDRLYQLADVYGVLGVLSFEGKAEQPL